MIFQIHRKIAHLFLFLTLCAAYATPKSQSHPHNANANAVSTIYQFEKGTWLENLAVAPNNNSVLVTRLDIPALYRINLPSHTGTNGSADLIYTFPNSTSCLGITEYTPNTYAVVVATNLSLTDLGPGDYTIWSVRFASEYSRNATVEKIADMKGVFLNGATTLSAADGTILVPDSLAGVVYKVDTKTGEWGVVLEDESMKPVSGSLGVNGIRVVDIGAETYLYYDNSNRTTIDRVRIDPVTGKAKGEYTELASGYWPDDLNYDYRTGTVYVAENSYNVIARVNSNGTETVVAGEVDQLTIAGPTSLVFGKGRHSRTMFVTTCGGQNSPLNGTVTEGAKLVAIQLDQL